MPHIKLEYTANICEKINAKDVLLPCYKILASTAKVELFRCQGRITKHDTFCIAEGSPKEAFIYLEVSFGEGRTPSMIESASNQILKHLEEYFYQSLEMLRLQIGVCFLEFPMPQYFKIESR
jgi:5-carboxymethyl-2-hydroxymuconate isomerase